MASVVTRYAKTERQMIMAILILSSIMSAGLSNSGTVAVFIPIILGITATTNFSRSKLMMSAFSGLWPEEDSLWWEMRQLMF